MIRLLIWARDVPQSARARLVSLRGSTLIWLSFNDDGNVVGNNEEQFALGAFDGDLLALDLGGNAGRDGHGLLSDTRHGDTP